MQAQWLPQHLRRQHHHPNIQRIGKHTVSKPTWPCKSTFSNRKYIFKMVDVPFYHVSLPEGIGQSYVSLPHVLIHIPNPLPLGRLQSSKAHASSARRSEKAAMLPEKVQRRCSKAAAVPLECSSSLAIQSLRSYWAKFHDYIPFTDLQKGDERRWSSTFVWKFVVVVSTVWDRMNLDGQDSQGTWEEMLNRKAKIPSQLCNNLCIMVT